MFTSANLRPSAHVSSFKGRRSEMEEVDGRVVVTCRMWHLAYSKSENSPFLHSNEISICAVI